MQPEYGMLRRSKLREEFIEIWLGDPEIEMGLKELINMFGRNQMGCQDQGCSCGQVEEFARGGGSSRVTEMAESRDEKESTSQISAGAPKVVCVLGELKVGFH